MAKTPTDIRSLARTHTKLSISTLVGVMVSPRAMSSAKVAAAREMLNRGWGASKETIEHGVTSELAELLKAIDGQTRGIPATPQLPHHRSNGSTH